MADPKYIVDQIMPVRRVHLMAGPSGAGKSTYMLQIIKELQQGHPIWGYDSFPQSLLYMCADRLEEDMRETIARVDSTLSIPVYSLIDNNIPMTIGTILKTARQVVPGVKLVILDGGLGLLVEEGRINDHSKVADMLRTAARLCKSMDITIIAILHSPKTKEGEGYLNPRQRLLGSVAWAAFSNAIILVEPGDAKEITDRNRIVSVLPRNAEEMTFRYTLDKQGCFVSATDDMDQYILDSFIRRCPYEQEISTAQMVAICQGVPKRTVERWIKSRVEQGLLQWIRHGFYSRKRTV